MQVRGSERESDGQSAGVRVRVQVLGSECRCEDHLAGVRVRVQE